MSPSEISSLSVRRDELVDDEHGAAAAYDDAEHRQSRPEFVRPERLKREM
jgi:hypothetical protein